MSENINEAAHDESAAAGDAARRSSAEAAALTAGSTPPEQQSHSSSASRFPRRSRAASSRFLPRRCCSSASVFLPLRVASGGKTDRLCSHLLRESKLRSRVAQRRRRQPLRSRWMPNLNPRCIRKGNPILPIRTANQIPPLGKMPIRIRPLTATAAGYPRIPAAPQAATPSLPLRRRAIPGRKLPVPEANSLLRRTSSPYRCRFPAAPSAIRFPPAGRTRSMPAPRPMMRCAPLACPSTHVAPRTEPTLPRSAGLPKKSTTEPPVGCTLSTTARP